MERLIDLTDERKITMEKCKYEGTGIWDGRCVGTKEVDPCPGYDKCKQYKPNYISNADRIRGLTDDELAKEFIRHVCCPPMKRRHCPDIPCYECWLNWLQQPVETEGQ